MPGSFADSNVVLYMASADQRKSSISEDVLGTGCTVSVQVLNAIANVLRRKHRFTGGEVREFLDKVKIACDVVAAPMETHLLGLNIAERYRLLHIQFHDRRGGVAGRVPHTLFGRHAARSVDRRAADHHQSLPLIRSSASA